MFIKVTPEGEFTRHDEAVPDLDRLYALLGCDTVEAISLTVDGDPFEATGWLSETGKRDGLDRNELGTVIAHKYSGIALGDFIAGSLVITGGPDGAGETQRLSESWMNRLSELVAETTGARETV
jgi:hypothetical protein